jgi:hypothetical protein
MSRIGSRLPMALSASQVSREAFKLYITSKLASKLGDSGGRGMIANSLQQKYVDRSVVLSKFCHDKIRAHRQAAQKVHGRSFSSSAIILLK